MTGRPPGTTLLVICGLRREAVRAAWRGVTSVVSGGSRLELERRLASIDPDFGAVVSFGLAGGLHPSLGVGDVVVPSEIWAADRRYRTSPELAARWMQVARRGTLRITETDLIAGVDAPVSTPADKAALRASTGAAAVDMESHVAAAYAERHGLPFGALRVVSDTVDRAVPPAAIAALRDDGAIDLLGAMKSLISQPSQVASLVRLGVDGIRAFHVLLHAGFLLQVDLDRHTS